MGIDRPLSLPCTAAAIAEELGARVVGDGTVRLRGLAALERAGEGALSFLSDRRLRSALGTTGASAVIVAPWGVELSRSQAVRALIVVDDPYLAFARVSQWFARPPHFPAGVHPTAVVAGRVAESTFVGPFVVVEEGAQVGERCILEAGVFVGREAVVGDGSWLGPRVVIGERCVVGKDCRIYAGAVIGADGFGYAWDALREEWVKIAQSGRVVIGDGVEIGANTTIDRGTVEDTVIEDGVKIDNLVQIGHNCRVGRATAIAGCVGLAGSTILGRRCRVGGQAGFAGHLEVADDVTIGAATLVSGSVKKPGFYVAQLPLLPFREWQRNAVWWRRLAEIGNWWRRRVSGSDGDFENG
ncbi:MAG: UDP-3-O-(3-hydroxymyristoyl)glucosamine N-acyltransferase [Hydrogenophilus sp.]|nr:UDP-3-O-(3-hydroxymyristoyl)glucosamine N-acyltransferase [Hydrogenophilus sp.]